VARIELAPEVGEDLARIVDHLEHHEATHFAARVDEIIGAIGILATNPLIGRPSGDDKRELVIGRGAHGYVALYRYVPTLGTVFVLAVRGQREAGFSQ
jgi:plasmid stabilization system protein ParE